MLFTELSIWTMIHGIVLGGAALMALATALFALRVLGTHGRYAEAAEAQARSLARLTVFIAAMLWLTVLVGTYIVFPPYRATPPVGTIELAQYPKSFIQASPRKPRGYMPLLWRARSICRGSPRCSQRQSPTSAFDAGGG